MISSEWLKKYELAKKYYEKHGDLLIPRSYVVMHGNENIKLGNWINTQKMAYKGTYHVRISEEQIRLLEEIGMVWDVKKYKKENIGKDWLKKYELARKYYEKYGDLLIPITYFENINNERINLGFWINRQRERYKGSQKSPLSTVEIKLLEEIGMIWYVREYQDENIDKTWLKKYELVKKYYEEHNNLLIPRDYEVMLDNKQVKLGIWIYNQRQKYNGNARKDLTDAQIKLLEEIGMVWDGRRYIYEEINSEWFSLYNIAKKYYETYGNLLIPYDYCVIDGNKEICLGAWVEAQKDKYNGATLIRLCDEQITLLEEIGITWNNIKYSDSDKINKEHTLKDK